MSPLSADDLIERLRREGSARYHDHHPFHERMHAGTLTREQLQEWVRNRFYYQSRIPIKDALILSKSEDSGFRRMWIHRLRDQDGDEGNEGGLVLWLRLAEGVGLDPAEVASNARVLPGVRYACDSYVELVRERSLVEAVASSLTEFFAPDLMSRRILAWEQHYPWVSPEMLAYFRTRVVRARRDSEEAIAFVLREAKTRDLQERCVAALVRKTEILWHLLDCLSAHYVDPGWGPGARPALQSKARLRPDSVTGRELLLYPERGMELNATAAEIVRHCTGEHTVDQIVARLCEKYLDRGREVIEREVFEFLRALAERGLVKPA
jgi:pyrroloquinoline-quinone synthase